MPDTSPNLRMRVFDFATVVGETDIMRTWRKGVLTI
jgi:hypothetical protein